MHIKNILNLNGSWNKANQLETKILNWTDKQKTNECTQIYTLNPIDSTNSLYAK